MSEEEITDENYCDWRQSNCPLVKDYRARIAELEAALDGLSEAFVEEMVSAGWIMRDIESVPAFRAARAARAALKGDKSEQP